jgi:DeoR family fructose operon transcriptional repressor
MVTKTMALHSSEVFLLCDSTKLEKKSYLKFAPLNMVHHLITDSAADKVLLEKYRKKGIDVIT